MLKTIYKMSENRTFNNTNNISKRIYQYTTDVVNDFLNQQSCKFKKDVLKLYW